VRRLARDLGVDLGSVSASGPGGRISREDVLRASEATPTRPLAQGEERIPISGVRRLVAQKMAKSASEIPHVTTFLTVDATSILAVRDAAQARTPDVKITPLAVVARAFVEILKDHPKLNASLDDDSNEIVLKRYYHLGIATDTDRGLIVPVVRDADTRDIGGLAAEINRLASLVRDMMATPEDVTGSTVTVSNVGSFGAEFGTPIINLPESSILALGVIRERPTVREGEIAVSLMVTLSLSFDHRIMDGAEAGRALLDLRKLLESSDALKKL
jgi:pyruvate dehydrogenase E2 component (dihydrolipoamide acetyltransferase)